MKTIQLLFALIIISIGNCNSQLVYVLNINQANIPDYTIINNIYYCNFQEVMLDTLVNIKSNVFNYKWYKLDNNILKEINGGIIEISDNNPIIFQFEDNQNCIYYDTIRVVTKEDCVVSNFNDKKSTNKIGLYPNPSKSDFNLIFSHPFHCVDMLIYNTLGLNVYYKRFINSNQEQLFIRSGLKPGTYFVKLLIDRNCIEIIKLNIY